MAKLLTKKIVDFCSSKLNENFQVLARLKLNASENWPMNNGDDEILARECEELRTDCESNSNQSLILPENKDELRIKSGMTLINWLRQHNRESQPVPEAEKNLLQNNLLCRCNCFSYFERNKNQMHAGKRVGGKKNDDEKKQLK